MKTGENHHLIVNLEIKTLKKSGGKLIEIPYTKGVSSTALSMEQNKKFTTPEIRLKNVCRLLEAKNFLRIIETHSPISALIAENINLGSSIDVTKNVYSSKEDSNTEDNYEDCLSCQ